MKGWLTRLLRPEPGKGASTPNATTDDIVACFRLLLGRAPNPEERAGHMAQAGQPLATVVAGYLNSLEFARRGLMRYELGRPELVSIEGVQLYVDPADIAVGRHVANGSYEPDVTAIVRRLLRPGMAVLDLGANIGFFTMLAAHLVGPAGSVLAVEPNPDNTRLLEASRIANGFDHVTVVQLAASRQLGLLSLNATHSNGTTAPFAAGLDGALAARPVACAPIDLLVPPDRMVDVIKIDVEGAELNALIGGQRLLERARPVILSEFSPGLLAGISGVDGPGYLAWLYRMGYRVSVVQTGGALEAAGQDPAIVMAAYERCGADHIDLLAEPLP